ncbi:MAG: CapA family protein [Burkholderiales bacterium]|nr:CapA family protein [Burkholderiales bacterium]
MVANRRQALVTLAAGGDVGTGHNPPDIAFAGVREALSRADIRFAQVERLYSERGSYQWQSLARKLEVRQPPSQAEVFRTVGFDVLSLASNHTGDWGPEAVEDTLDTFCRLGIATVGAGRNIEQARRPAIMERNGLRIAFLGYCSVVLPQYWADDERAGCAPMRAHTLYEPYEYQPGSPARVVTVAHEEDLDLLVQDVRSARANADAVVVSMHWGLHYVARPFAYQTVVAHAAIDAGAAVVLGHHPHQPQGVEIYQGAAIFYSLGNFAFHRRGGGLAYCMPNGEHTHKSVYTIDVDPGISYDYKRHWNEGGIAYLDLDRDGLARAAYAPTLLDDRGAPQLVARGDPQFDRSRNYLEWAAAGMPGGVTAIGVEDDRFLLYARGAQTA